MIGEQLTQVLNSNDNRKWLITASVLILIIAGGAVFFPRFTKNYGQEKGENKTDVSAPTIVNGDLVLPKVTTKTGLDFSKNNLGKSKLGVVSANLMGVYEGGNSPGSESKLTAIRVIGEMVNLGDTIIDGFSPYLRFLDGSGKSVGQKIGKLSAGYELHGLMPGETTLYDLTVENPPLSDRLEIVLNVSSSTSSAAFVPLKIEGRNIEFKYAEMQASAPTPSSSPSAGSAKIAIEKPSPTALPSAVPTSTSERVQYYIVSGKVVNATPDPVSDIIVYVWVKNSENKVFGFGKVDYRNDLIASGEKIDFKINLLPFKIGETYDKYEVAVWGRPYKLLPAN